MVARSAKKVEGEFTVKDSGSTRVTHDCQCQKRVRMAGKKRRVDIRSFFSKKAVSHTIANEISLNVNG